MTLGLLTGNLEPCARLKLEPIGANRFFAFGAFGSDDEDRYRLAPVALARAREATGIAFEGREAVIVGDSVHDVLCGRGVGVRAVAVATGKTAARDARRGRPRTRSSRTSRTPPPGCEPSSAEAKRRSGLVPGGGVG